MQAVYTPGFAEKKNMRLVEFFSAGGFERSKKRSPYEDLEEGNEPEKNGGSGKLLYVLITILCLLVLWPVGLILLWRRRDVFSVFASVVLTLASAAVFCTALVLLANADIDNPRVEAVQEKLNVGLEWTYEKAENAKAFISEKGAAAGEDINEKLEYVWNGVKPSVAAKTSEILKTPAEQAKYYKQELPCLVVAKYSELMGKGYRMPEKVEAKTTTEVNVTPEPEEIKPESTPLPTVPVNKEPEPASTPILLPEIKDVSEAPVYYTTNGRAYHLTNNCSGMSPEIAESHTLAEAKKDGKAVCDVCGVADKSLIDKKDLKILWIDDKKVAHTTDVCLDFEGTYRIVTFENAYAGNYKYCEKCSADVCLAYMRSKDVTYNAVYEGLDIETQRLYDYEKAITVYYGENSRLYHSTQKCQQMYAEENVHTLYDALHTDVLRPCTICTPFNEEDCVEEIAKAKNKTE